MKYIIITSINDITDAIIKFSKRNDWHVVVVGDTKSRAYTYPNVTYLSIETQLGLAYDIVSSTPVNHYSRKNIGYLYAIKNGATSIYDTDDDTFPYDNWAERPFECNTVIGGSKFINPYKFYTDEHAWPRGIDIAYIRNEDVYVKTNHSSSIGVWQGVIDGDSDFDAIYRLTINKPITFRSDNDVVVANNCYAPFNTQSTLWNPVFYALLYIPISVDFRFTDILRGYISQRIMWEYGYNVGFHSPNTYQIRNEHDYYKDFLGEITMYKSVPAVIRLLDEISLEGASIESDLVNVYTRLYSLGVVMECELCNLNNWISDLACNIGKKSLS
jgi:hypothetical protein